jgi:hypothetical protein
MARTSAYPRRMRLALLSSGMKVLEPDPVQEDNMATYPARYPARGPLFNGAKARQYQIGPLQRESLVGTTSLRPYAAGWTMPGFGRLGLKPVKPLKGPPDQAPGTPPPTGP